MALAPGVIRVDDVWESFRTYTDDPTGLKDRLVGRRKRVKEEFWALQGVSFDLEPGAGPSNTVAASRRCSRSVPDSIRT
jgi:hypothetical protein